MGILDTVKYLNTHPIKEQRGRHGNREEEAEAKRKLEQEIKKRKQYQNGGFKSKNNQN